jgi:hypothetical protein
VRRRSFLRGVALLLPGGLIAAGTACAATPRSGPLEIRQPLPDDETLSYSLLDSDNKPIGSATVAVKRTGDALVLTQNYMDLQQHLDAASVTVDAVSMKPRSAMHQIDNPPLHTTLFESYSGTTVTATANDGSEHRHTASITAASYDNLESFFLMRVVNFSAGDEHNLDLVVVDAAKGTISRAAGTIRVQGTTAITVAGKSFKTWQVQLTGAGATNTAWFEDAPGRRMLRYNNSRGTILELKAT